jgi:peptidoglycan/LPS O-acetylase OafA/YrhL
VRPALSVYLDFLRFLAAFGVLISHAKGLMAPRVPWILASHAAECVAVFFVLSGFVIRFANQEKGEAQWRNYAVARLSRIVPVVTFALLMTIVLDMIGGSINPSFYAAIPWYAGFSISGFLLNLFYLNEIWFTHTIFGSNGPLWSLGFEVPYYILFGLFVFAPRWVRVTVVCVWAFIFGPKVVAYLSLWLLGVATYDAVRSITTSGTKGRIVGALGVGVSIAGYAALKYGGLFEFHRIYDPLSVADFTSGVAYYFAVALLVSLNIISTMLVFGDSDPWPPALKSAIRWFAGGSFTLYVVHLPIVILLTAVFGVARDLPTTAAMLAAVIAAAYLLAEVVERRKKVFRTLFNGLFYRSAFAPPY